MGDPALDKLTSRARDETKNLLRAQLREKYCSSGGDIASCNSNVDTLVDIVYNTGVYIIKIQKANPGKPVPVAVVIEFTASQMKSLGKWGGSDMVYCAASTVKFALSLKTLTTAIAINGVIATSAASSGLGMPVALGAGALAFGAAALLVWNGYETYNSCSPIFTSNTSAVNASASSGENSFSIDINQNKRQSEDFLYLLNFQMQSTPNSCNISR